MNEDNLYHKQIREMAKNDHRIIFVGEVLGKDKDALFKGAYSFCMPSELEGMSIALLEAMSYKKSCIVSNIQENMDVAEGRCISFNNKNIKSLIEALIKAERESKEDRTRRGRDAFEYVKANHLVDNVAKEMLRLYKNVLAS